MNPEATGTALQCAECAHEADEHARGWRALLGRKQPADQPETIVFCRDCAEREFGPERDSESYRLDVKLAIVLAQLRDSCAILATSLRRT